MNLAPIPWPAETAQPEASIPTRHCKETEGEKSFPGLFGEQLRSGTTNSPEKASENGFQNTESRSGQEETAPLLLVNPVAVQIAGVEFTVDHIAGDSDRMSDSTEENLKSLVGTNDTALSGQPIGSIAALRANRLASGFGRSDNRDPMVGTSAGSTLPPKSISGGENSAGGQGPNATGDDTAAVPDNSHGAGPFKTLSMSALNSIPEEFPVSFVVQENPLDHNGTEGGGDSSSNVAGQQPPKELPGEAGFPASIPPTQLQSLHSHAREAVRGVQGSGSFAIAPEEFETNLQGREIRFPEWQPAEPAPGNPSSPVNGLPERIQQRNAPTGTSTTRELNKTDENQPIESTDPAFSGPGHIDFARAESRGELAVAPTPVGGVVETAAVLSSGPHATREGNLQSLSTESNFETTEMTGYADNSGEIGTPQVNAVRLLERAGGAEIRVRLQSDALGTVELRAETRENGVGAVLRVEKAETHNLLRSELPALQQVLGEHDARLEEIALMPETPGAESSLPYDTRSGSQDSQEPQERETRPFITFASRAVSQTPVLEVGDSRGLQTSRLLDLSA